MKPEQLREFRLNRRIRLPHSVKNPRKLKKTMKRMITENFVMCHMATLKECRCRLHWIPKRGWTITQREKRK